MTTIDTAKDGLPLWVFSRRTECLRSEGDVRRGAVRAGLEMNLEGIVGKDLVAPYKRGVQPTWVKIKTPSCSRPEALGFR